MASNDHFQEVTLASGTGTTDWIILNPRVKDWAASLTVNGGSNGTATYTVQTTLDELSGPTDTATTVVNDANTSDQTGNVHRIIRSIVSAIRVNVTANANNDSIILTVRQGGQSNG